MEGAVMPTAVKRTSSRRTPGFERKSERLEARVAPAVKETIHRAMAVSGLAVGDLAYEGARRVLEDHERMRLTGADRELFLKALADPPTPTERLQRAAAAHRVMTDRAASGG
jgi:uncharacterized protein (DUF1778 family)